METTSEGCFCTAHSPLERRVAALYMPAVPTIDSMAAAGNAYLPCMNSPPKYQLAQLDIIFCCVQDIER